MEVKIKNIIKKITPILLGSGSLFVPVAMLSENKNVSNNTNITLKENGQIDHMKIWKFKNGDFGIVIGKNVTVDNTLINGLFNGINEQGSIEWIDAYNPNKEGKYTLEFKNNNSETQSFTIYVAGEESGFGEKQLAELFSLKSAQAKKELTLPSNFALPSSVTTIGKAAFQSLKLNDDFKISSSVKTIGQSAFQSTRLNKGFVIPNNVTSLGAYAFSQTTLNDNFTIPEAVENIGKGVFESATLNASFKIPNSVTSIGVESFKDAKLNPSFKIPETVTSIGENAFEEANLNDDFKILNPNITIGNNVFENATFLSKNISSISTLKKAEKINEWLSKFKTIKPLKDYLDSIVRGYFETLERKNILPEELDCIALKGYIKRKISNEAPDEIKKYFNNDFNEITVKNLAADPNGKYYDVYAKGGFLDIQIFNNDEKLLEISGDKNHIEGFEKNVEVIDFLGNALELYFAKENPKNKLPNEFSTKDLTNFIKEEINKSSSQSKISKYFEANSTNFVVKNLATDQANSGDYKWYLNNGILDIQIFNDDKNLKIFSGDKGKRIKGFKKFGDVLNSLEGFFESLNINDFNFVWKNKELVDDFKGKILNKIKEKISALNNDKFSESLKKEIMDNFSNDFIDYDRNDFFGYLKIKIDFKKFINKFIEISKLKDVNTSSFKDNFEIEVSNPTKKGEFVKDIKAWHMELDVNGKKLPKNEQYYGFIVPKSLDLAYKDYKKILTDFRSISFKSGHPYDKDTEGVYSATVTKSDGSTFKLKIFVTDESFGWYKKKSFFEGFLQSDNDRPIGFFKNKTIPENFTIPNFVTSISKEAFSFTKLNKNFKIPISVTRIGEYSFSYTKLNDDFTIPSSVTSIGKAAFGVTELNKNFKIPNSVTSIEEQVFYGSKLNEGFTIPNTIKSIRTGVFQGAILNEDFSIPNTVTSIGEQSFAKAQLNNNFKIPSSVTSIGKAAFGVTELNNDFSIPNTVTSIGEQSFAYAQLNNNFKIPNSVTSIGKNVFKDAIFLSKKVPQNISNSKSVEEINKWLKLEKDKKSELENVKKIEFNKYLNNIMETYFKNKLSSTASPDEIKKYIIEKIKGNEVSKEIKEYFKNNYINFTVQNFALNEVFDKGIFNIQISNDNIILKIFNNIKVWHMESDAKGEKLPENEQYYGFIVFKGLDLLESDFETIFKDNDFKSISFDEGHRYDKDTEGIYSGTVTKQNGSTFRLKIFVTDETFGGKRYFLTATNDGDSEGHIILKLKTPVADDEIPLENYGIFKNKTIPKNFSIPNGVKIIQNDGVEIRQNDGVEITQENQTDDFIKNIFDYVSNLAGDILGSLNKDLKSEWSKNDNSKNNNSKIGIIEDSLFSSSKLNSNFKIPNTVTSIGKSAFKGVNLNDDFTIPNSVTSIGEGAFKGAQLNDKLIIPDSVTSVGEEVFKDTIASPELITKTKERTKKFIEELVYPKINIIAKEAPEFKKALKKALEQINDLKENILKKIKPLTEFNDIVSLAYNKNVGSGIEQINSSIIAFYKMIAKEYIYKLDYPNLENKLNSDKIANIIQLQQDGFKNIENETSIDEIKKMISSKSTGSDVIKINEAIKKYNTSFHDGKESTEKPKDNTGKSTEKPKNITGKSTEKPKKKQESNGSGKSSKKIIIIVTSLISFLGISGFITYMIKIKKLKNPFKNFKNPFKNFKNPFKNFKNPFKKK